jgi:hypothetical protein
MHRRLSACSSRQIVQLRLAARTLLVADDAPTSHRFFRWAGRQLD